MFANFMIGLREGLEAALIVSILLAYLVKSGHRNQVHKIYAGTAAAILVSAGLGFTLNLVLKQLAPGTEEAIAGVISVAAAAMVTWMIFWMAKQSRELGGQLRSKVDEALGASVWALVAVAFFSVIREGIETSMLLWSAAKATGDAASAPGAILGLLAAALLGVLLYRGAIKVNLTVFFKYTGIYLIVVAAGILAYGVHEFQEIGLLPILEAKSYDLTWLIAKDSPVDSLLRGLFGFRVAPSLLETVVWFGYIVPVTTLYLQSYSKPKKLVNA